MAAEIRYCTTEDDVRIAWSVTGQGDRWLVHTSNLLLATLQFDAIPRRHDWFDLLGESFKVLQYEPRGTGLSQRDVADLSFESLRLDIDAVIRASGAEDCVLFGYLAGTYAAVEYAAHHPASLSHLVLWPPPVDVLNPESRQINDIARLAVSDWVAFTELFSHLGIGWERGEQSHAFALAMRETITQTTFLKFWGGVQARGRDTLYEHARDVFVPTLLLQRPTYKGIDLFAAPISGATTRMIDGTSINPYTDNPRLVVQAIAEFAGVKHTASEHAEPSSRDTPSGTAIILFTDIADSTPLTERMGDTAFRTASRRIDDDVRTAIRDAGGTPVSGKVLGDGVMGVFTSATQAIRAARRCVEASGDLPLHIGLHAGDVIREGDNVYGGAVNIASRICGLCAPGEILVSATVRELARTSAGVTFEDRGEQPLKGIEDMLRVYAVRSQA